ncbi:U2 snRNP-associated SURP motif-containing protein-like isoform X2 [Tubulanus polymorphus]|uniref:U2 snRNP-associated SURP motif-containing protein-like isoform X2 n=1 Tax=Tubulanus polymorphus TaxID=672921 RepID=UPI003DA2B11D
MASNSSGGSSGRDRLPWGLKTDSVAPGSMKTISETKLKAFNSGSTNLSKKSLTKREQEELKKREDEQAAKKAYEDFVAAFEDVGKHHNKSWVKGGVVNPGDREKNDSRDRGGRLYRPTSKMADSASKDSRKDERQSEKPALPGKKSKEKEKKKSNLELFKEELKMIQAEREERTRIKKHHVRGSSSSGGGGESSPIVEPEKPTMVEPAEPVRQSRFEPALPELPPAIAALRGPASSNMSLEGSGFKPAYSTWEEDSLTTNLYLGNVNPKMTEQQLCVIFGQYGPLASVKIMWPRSEEERSRGRNCGFVAFMNRKDGERCLAALKGKDVMGFEMKLGWGKSVPIPAHPVYIPPALVEMTLPPPPSGLPFNAQPRSRSAGGAGGKYANIPPPGLGGDSNGGAGSKSDADKTLTDALVKVVIPTERNLLCIIHRMIEFVVREGPMFEAMIMNRELNNPMFRFLFENMSPAHVYYRWKLFSILQGDSPYKWRMEEFRMFKGGSLWKPPPVNPYMSGMPEELVNKKSSKDKKGQLTDSQRDRLEDMLREMTPERSKIGDLMVWCLDHAESAEEIVECIAESLSILETPIPKKIARLYLISDILHNSSAKVPNASFFRKFMEPKLMEIFKDIHDAYEKIDARLKAEQFKQKVMNCFRAWEDWAIYPNDFLIRLQNVFLGLVSSKEKEDEMKDEDFDGIPIETGDLDGKPLDEGLDGVELDLDGIPMSDRARSPPPFKSKWETLDSDNGDLDGKPLDEEEQQQQQQQQQQTPKPRFASTKWETVDESELEKQAITTSKWEMFEQPENVRDDEDIDGRSMEDESPSRSRSASRDRNSASSSDEAAAPSRREEMTEERRTKLREVEMKVVKYQDEIEAGKRSRKPDLSIVAQVQRYRQKLLQKTERKRKLSPGSHSPSPVVASLKRRSRTPPSGHTEYSNSPMRKKNKRSRSRSPLNRSNRSRRSVSPSRGTRKRSASSSASPRRRSSPSSPLPTSSSSSAKRKHKHKKGKH